MEPMEFSNLFTHFFYKNKVHKNITRHKDITRQGLKSEEHAKTL